MRGLKLIIIIIIVLSGISSSGKTLSSAVLAKKSKILPSSSSEDTSRINSLTRRGLLYLSNPVKMPDKAKACIDSAELFCERKEIEIPALLHLLRAEYFYYTGDFRSALEEALEGKNKAEIKGESIVAARIMLFMGYYYLRTGFFKESMEYFGKTITLSTKENLKGIIPESYQGLANLNSTIGDINSLRKNLLLMIEAAYSENDSLSVEAGYYRLGTEYCGIDPTDKKRNFRMADSFLKKCLEISVIRKDTFYTAFSLANIGWNYYLQEMYDSSLTCYNESFRYSQLGKLYETSANSLGNIGTIYRDLGKTDIAIKYYIKAIEEAKKINHWYTLAWVHKDMSDLYIKTNDTSNAFKSYVQFKKFSDSLLIKSKTQGLADARLRYEADSHNKEVALLSLRLKNNRILNYGFAGFILLTGTIGLLLLRGSKLKAKRRISEMNRQISEITQANLRQQMNPHFIFNTLNSIQYYMYQHDKLATNNYLTKFSSLMRKVLENSQHTSVPLQDELDALNLYLELECLRFKDKFDYEINIDEDIDPILFRIPTMLIQPYVENSICHGLMPREGKGFVKIEMRLEKDYIKCTIEDNGIGRKASSERKMKREANHNSLGTQIVSSRLDLVNTLYGTSLKTTYADLKNENGEPEGTRVEIHIPILT